jgi:prevent-host-death family protein
MQAVNIFEAKNKLSGLVAKVEQEGASYLICRNGKPVAELVRHQPRNRLKALPTLHVEVAGPLFDDDMSEDWECLN